jgi:adenylate cyclase
MHEIERKFFMQEMPDISGIQPVRYERYILEQGGGIEIRISKIDDTYTYEKKVAISNLERMSESRKITKKEFDELKQNVSEVIIRDKYTVSENPKIAVQIYHGKFEGLVRVEVEFTSRKEAIDFNPLSWMGKEITGLPIARDGELIHLSTATFKSYLT